MRARAGNKTTKKKGKEKNGRPLMLLQRKLLQK
jgi:hypothetical protein